MEEDTVVRLPRPGANVADDPLLEVLRSGARRMLQQVIEAEVEAFLGAHADLEDANGRRRVVRNGHAPERHWRRLNGPERLGPLIEGVRFRDGEAVHDAEEQAAA